MLKNWEKTVKNVEKSLKILNSREKSVKNIEKRLQMSKNHKKTVNNPNIIKNVEKLQKTFQKLKNLQKC